MFEPPRPSPLRKPKAPKPRKPPESSQKSRQQGRCPSGFRWDSKKGKCVQAGVGPKYKP